MFDAGIPIYRNAGIIRIISCTVQGKQPSQLNGLEKHDFIQMTSMVATDQFFGAVVPQIAISQIAHNITARQPCGDLCPLESKSVARTFHTPYRNDSMQTIPQESFLWPRWRPVNNPRGDLRSTRNRSLRFDTPSESPDSPLERTNPLKKKQQPIYHLNRSQPKPRWGFWTR